MLKGFVLGVVITLAAAALIGYVGVTQGLLIPANADAPPGKLETWVAKQSLRATVGREASSSPNPLATTVPNLLDGIKVYGENCAVCHGVADGRPSTIAAGLYQNAPQLAKDGVEDDPAGVIYWKVQHGIRLTGMPAFGPAMSEQRLWAVTLFLQNMDKLPPAADQAWKKLKNPAPPAPADEHQKKGRD